MVSEDLLLLTNLTFLLNFVGHNTEMIRRLRLRRLRRF